MFRLKTTLLTILIFNFFIAQAQEEQPYKCEKDKSIVLFSLGSTGMGLSYYLHQNVNVLSTDKIEILDKNSVNRFDRIATKFSSMHAKKASDVFFFTSLAAPSFLMASRKMRKDAGLISLMYGQVLFLNLGVTSLTKKSVLRSRPLVYNPNFALADKTERNARYSFFSGHASVVSSNCFLTAKVFSDYFPDSKWRHLVWGVAATAPAITGYLRVRAGKHYPSDVITGYIVGAGIGVLVPHFHRNVQKKISENLTFSVLPTGGYLSIKF